MAQVHMFFAYESCVLDTLWFSQDLEIYFKLTLILTSMFLDVIVGIELWHDSYFYDLDNFVFFSIK